ncbi:MAG: hypothetical protein NTX50_04170 [Candidatus Sumerlaeota bacterium]|nr:hypothetical protein [Candidatus Sumerlaeota bacterium]
MTGRERILKAIAFEETDRVAIDLGGMRSTCISCFAYPDLVRALGLPPRRPRVYDTSQMLALPDPDVLDALQGDVVTVALDGSTDAFAQPELWRDYDFGGRLEAQVRNPLDFKMLEDGTISQPASGSKMPPKAHVFETEHAGQQFNLAGDIPKPDLQEIRKAQEKSLLRPEEIRAARDLCRRVRESTDRAVFFNGVQAGLCIHGFGGVAVFPTLCLAEPDFVAELHELIIRHSIRQMEALLSEIGPYIDICLVSADDWGSQSQTFAPPHVFETLFKPYYTRINAAIHRAAPNVKTFLHSCGAIYNILDLIIGSGFDILNPVQWTAGGRSWKEWKDKCRRRITLWGGGVNTQATLPFGTVADVEREAGEIASYMRRDGGYVFCAIHNLLAEIPGEKVAAMYRAAARAK